MYTDKISGYDIKEDEMRENYREDLNHIELITRTNPIKNLSADDYNKLPVSIKQAIEFIYDAISGDKNNEMDRCKNGIILCACGGQIISNSGKVYYDHKTNMLSCWGCGKTYNSDYAYSMRKENETISITEEPKKIYFKAYQDKNNMNGNSYIDTIENHLKMLNDIISNCEECGDELFPVFEIVKMTESEFKTLPEFIGY